jgi:hypothetical protein
MVRTQYHDRLQFVLSQVGWLRLLSVTATGTFTRIFLYIFLHNFLCHSLPQITRRNAAELIFNIILASLFPFLILQHILYCTENCDNSFAFTSNEGRVPRHMQMQITTYQLPDDLRYQEVSFEGHRCFTVDARNGRGISLKCILEFFKKALEAEIRLGLAV